MRTALTIAAVQCPALFDDVTGASAHILARAQEAAAAGARLILFPECYLQGHSYNSALVARRAMPIDSPAITVLAQALALVPIMAVVGFFERRGNLIFNSAMVIAEGHVIGSYAKHDPREGGCTAGTERPVFECDGWPFAISICRDTRSSELALDFATRGARLLLYPLGNMLPPDIASENRHFTLTGHVERARETGCWVITADVVGTHEGWIGYGNTRVLNPMGEVIADVSASHAGMIIATIG